MISLLSVDLATALERVDRLIGQHPQAEHGTDMLHLEGTVAIETVLRRRGVPMRPVEVWADLRATGRSNDLKMEVQVTTYDLWRRGRIDKVGRGQYVTKRA